MGVHDSSETDPRTLLALTVRDPLADLSSTHVRGWLKFLVDRFGLWTLQSHAYAQFHRSILPSTYPLSRFVKSILADEGLDDEEPVFLESLLATLDRRRSGIAKGEATVAEWIDDDDEKPRKLAPVYSRFRPAAVTDLTYWEPDSEHSVGGIVSPYGEIERELLTHIDDQRFARDKPERARAKTAWHGFLEALMALLPAHRPGAMPPDPLMEALVQEGRELMQLCWDVPVEISAATSEIFVAEGVQDEPEMIMWATRLALPIFSRPELLALKAHAAATQRSGRPTPQRFAIWVLAHRLQIPAHRIARRFVGRGESEHFKVPNPIEEFLTFP